MSTHSKAGDGQRLASRILFAEVTRFQTLRNGLCNMLTSDAMSVVRTDAQKAQSNAGAPIVLVKDLQKSHGDNVSVDIIHEATGLPTMGDGMIEGNDEPLTRSSFELRIDQYRKSVTQGGKMTQQRRGYNMIRVGKQALTSYFPRLKTELMLCHLAGARGDYEASDVILPLDTPNSQLDEFLVNPLKAPTFDRCFYAGNADSIDGTTGNAITPADVFDITSLDKMATALQEMAHPPQAIDLSTEDKPMQTDPFYLFLVSPRMWRSFKQNSSNYDELVAQATRRAAGFNHHLFKGDCFMSDNILVRKMHIPVRHMSGSMVKVADDNLDATEHEEEVPSGVVVDTGILLGAQALAWAMGRTVPGTTFNLVNEKYDGNNKHRSIMEWMSGLAKIRFKDKDGRMNDYGCCVMKAAVDLTG